MPSDGCALYEPRTQLKVLAEREMSLRLPAETPPTGPLLGWTRVLEVSLVFASAHEAIVTLGIATCADVVPRIDEIDALVETLCHLSPAAVFEENSHELAPYARMQPAATAPATGYTEDVVRAVRSLLLHFPEALMEAEKDAAPALVHRCRHAFDGLRSFVARHMHPSGQALRTAGRAYAEGRLDLDEVARVLGMSSQDAVALLEEQGLRRPVGGLRLSADERTARYRALLEEQRARSAQPVVEEAWVSREVIASQRIEDIDARPWLRR